jgi:hypothetical protein
MKEPGVVGFLERERDNFSSGFLGYAIDLFQRSQRFRAVLRLSSI